ncbi:hypothetical protein LTR37_006561 [Vermiconidia calcicola]|uniref:Uncharacterized protein n=1 Tax=Vermiconidia calcicola TaxID=1690605 RepID=A0ACC3NG59_9PEZI|nr:hypothetical protein LTR37_006561 [Vermiconidia calcicola]
MFENAMDEVTLKQYLADDPPTVVPLAIKPHFEALSEREKKYAHYISRASLTGTRINLRQVSQESEPIYDFILALHRSCHGDWKKLASDTGLSDEDMRHFLNYSAQFLGNTGNFKSFGDSKFIPRMKSDKFAALAKASTEVQKLYDSFKDDLYESKTTARMHLGYPDEGHISTYYPDSAGITKEEISIVSEFLKERQFMPENTRLRQTSSGDFDLLVASAVKDPATRDIKEDEFTLGGALEGKKLRIVYGDHQTEMAKIANDLMEARKNALNQEEDAMQADYVKAFHDGSMQAHKDSQRHWIRDRGKSHLIRTCINTTSGSSWFMKEQC